jgi:hypothetical protein
VPVHGNLKAGLGHVWGHDKDVLVCNDGLLKGLARQTLFVVKVLNKKGSFGRIKKLLRLKLVFPWESHFVISREFLGSR